MSKAPRELRMPLQNTTLTDSSMSLHTTRTLIHHPSSSAQRYRSLGLVVFQQLTLSEQGRGEQVVRSIFPETTIVRPAPLFGFEDRLLHKLAGVTNILTSNHMQERYNPVHVSMAICLCIYRY